MKKDKFLAALVMTSCLFSIGAFAPQAMAQYTLDQEAEITLWTDYIRDYANDAFGYVSRANIHLDAREYAKAIADYDAALKIDQYNTDAYVKRGNAKYQMNNLEGALKDYAVALEINKNIPEARFNVGRVYYRTQDYAKAIQNMRAGIALGNAQPEYYFELARAEYKTGAYKEAYANFVSAVNLKSDYTDAYYGAGLAAMNLSLYEQAVVAFSKVIASGQKYENAHYYKGVAQYQLGQYAPAVQEFDIAIQENPQDGMVYNYRGKAKEMLGDKPAAKRDYKEAKTLGVTAVGLNQSEKISNVQSAVKNVEQSLSNNGGVIEQATEYPHSIVEEEILEEEMYKRLAAENIASGDIYSAVAMYDEVVQNDPTNASNYIERASLKLKGEDFDGAIRDAEAAIKAGANRGQAMFIQGKAYAGKGNNVLAYRALAIALREMPENNSVRYEFAKAANDVRRFADANEALTLLLQNDTVNYQDAYLLRGKARYQLSEFYSAIADLTKYLSIEPKSGDAYFYRAMAKSALKSYDEAVEDYSKALRYDRNNTDYLKFRARAYTAQGKYQKASSDYKKIITLKGENVTTEDHLRVAQIEGYLGNAEEALIYFDAIVQDDDLNSDVYYERAKLYEKMGRFYDAVNDYTRSLSLDPTKVEIYGERGVILVTTKAYRKGILDLDKALKLDPNNSKYYFYRAVAKESSGDHAGAVRDYASAKQYENL